MYSLHYAPDNASLIIRLALEELGAPYETRLVDRSVRAQDSAEYRAVSPTGLIPALQVGTQTLFETGAILLWLADTHGAMAPATSDPARAQFLKWLFFTSNTLHADIRMHFYAEKYGGSPKPLDEFTNATRARIAQHLTLLNTAATESPDIFMGPAPTVLGLYVAVLTRWLHLYPRGQTGWFDLAAYPALHHLAAQIEARPATQRACIAEGLGAYPLTAPQYAAPPEGSAT